MPATFGKQQVVVKRAKMEIDAPLKPPEYRRDEQGQFARPEGFTLRRAQKKAGIKKQKSRTAENNLPKDGQEVVKAGPGRPKGAKGKIPLALKEAM